MNEPTEFRQRVAMNEETEFLALFWAAAENRRGYAGFFGWSIDRDIEEWGVVHSLADSLKADGALFFTALKPRGRPNDPPDCEALDSEGRRVAIEVTELVDGCAIRTVKNGRIDHWAAWSKEKFLSDVAALIVRKGSRFSELKEPPYEGGYVVVMHTDEPMLNQTVVGGFLAGRKFARLQHIDRVFLLLSYEPDVQRCPYFELEFDE